MQINTRQAMMRAFKLHQKYGSWEEAERATNATKHTLEVILGGPLDEQSPPGDARTE